MGTTTFSGPIRAGNIRNTTGTVVGTDIANVGYVVMTQQHVMDISGGGTLTWKNTGTSDLKLTATSSAGTNAGSVVITVMYAQAFNTAVQP